MKRFILLFYIALSSLSVSLAQSAYINRVYEYRPAPGQFINTMPEYSDGDTEESMTQKAEDCIADHTQTMICLGGFGGYVVFGFDHTIENVSGHYDFTVLGNAFYSNSANLTDTCGGSAEPGIVFVSRDDNGNGLPDDKWYEIAGSEYYKATTKHNITITYHRPDAGHVATPDPSYRFITDTSYVAWNTSDGLSGYVYKNSFHSQNYYPDWIEADELSLTGTLLPNNAVDLSTNGTNFLLYCLGYGYCDNHPNTDDRSKFNIEWAVDDDGNHVSLDGIDFVKVQTGLNQYAGWLGETRTEVADAWDLHLTGGDDVDVYYEPESSSAVRRIQNSTSQRIVYDMLGRKVSDTSRSGMYLIVENGMTRKIIVH